ncbi:MAG TPA: FtsX-like permease family protein [Candidatus Paceibacterota bacterium]
MEKNKGAWTILSTDIRVGMFLARRELKRASKWTTGLIIFVMLLTFLNLVVVGGILVGLIEGSVEADRRYSSGDILISPFLNKSYIEHTPEVVAAAKTIPGFHALAVRYTGSARVESNYRSTVKPGEMRDGAGASLLGIDPMVEHNFSGIEKFVVEGSFITAQDTDSVVVGKNLLYKYVPIEAPGFQTLKDVTIGSKIKVTVGGDTAKEYYVKGVISSKVDTFDSSVIMVDSEARALVGRRDFNANQIAIQLDPGADSNIAKAMLLDAGIGEYARVQTHEEAMPKFLKDIQATFAILGNAISSIGLVVAAITIFIVIFVNAITRRRFIGILKGIGISPRAIAVSYIIQSIFYALLGSAIGIAVVFGLLKPFFVANPIDFPFSDGILVATIPGTLLRTMILLVATIIAGYIPARIVIKQNTLSAILGR